jgi:hypothetical protein
MSHTIPHGEQSYGRPKGITLSTPTTLWENRPARGSMRRLGVRARARHEVDQARALTQPPTIVVSRGMRCGAR